MLAATETTKDSILSIIITPFQKRQVLGSEKIIAQNLRSEQYFRRCVCVFFGAILVWRIRLIWRIFFCVVEGGIISLLCVRMYCIFSTLPLDVENTVTRTQSLKVAVSEGAGMILLF